MSKENIMAKYAALSPDACPGTETCVELNEKHEAERKKIIIRHMKNGVHFPLLDGVIISPGAEIGEGTVIMPGTIIAGAVKIGRDCVIGPNSYIEDSVFGDGCVFDSSQCRNSLVKDNASIGPFAHIRPGSVISDGVHLGNFTEVKNSNIGNNTKVSHLTYVGDSDVGERVNFGCGCVTVNYTGKEKFRTVIGDNAFIGCNTNLIAPVNVGDYAYTAAGSTITDDVPTNALGIARARQENKENWVLKKKPYKGM